jgi:predicted CoA-binding protein
MHDDEIREILENARTIAVVGISNKVDRDSFRVAGFLMKRGYRVIPVNPAIDQVLGLRSLPSLRDLEERVDVVDVFRRSDQVMRVVEDAIAIGAKVVWMQEGVINEDAAQRARDAGLKVVMDRCMQEEYKRLLGEGEEFAEGMP